MKNLNLKSLVTLVGLSAVCCFIQPRAEAMLAPASTLKSAPHVDQEQDVQMLQIDLEAKILEQKLQALGLSYEEIKDRLSRLSDTEIHQLVAQSRAIHPAGGSLFGFK